MNFIGDNLQNDEEIQKEMVRIAQASRAKRKMTQVAIVTIALIVAVFAAWMFGRSQMQQEANRIKEESDKKITELEEKVKKLEEEPIVVEPVAPTISLEVIYNKISDVAELATVEYLFTDAAKFSDAHHILEMEVPFTQKSFILRWEGVIKAGVDLKQVKIDVDEEAKKVIVKIPAAKILSYSVNNDKVEVLDEKNNIFNNITIKDKVEFDSKTEESMRKRAIENGILKKAAENAKDVLLRLVQSDPVVASEYTVEFGRVN